MDGEGPAINPSIMAVPPGKQHNLMTHTNTHPSSNFLLLSALNSSSVLFLPVSLSAVLHFSLCTALSLNVLPRESHPNPTPLTTLPSPKFQGDGTHKSQECSWAPGWRRKVEMTDTGLMGMRDRQIDGGEGGILVTQNIFRTEICS